MSSRSCLYQLSTSVTEIFFYNSSCSVIIYGGSFVNNQFQILPQILDWVYVWNSSDSIQRMNMFCFKSFHCSSFYILRVIVLLEGESLQHYNWQHRLNRFRGPLYIALSICLVLVLSDKTSLHPDVCEVPNKASTKLQIGLFNNGHSSVKTTFVQCITNKCSVVILPLLSLGLLWFKTWLALKFLGLHDAVCSLKFT